MTSLNTLLGLGLLLLTFSAVRAEDEAEAKKSIIPSFRPGAEVTVGITVHAPAAWSLNPGIPLRVSIDQKLLKTAPFTVDKAEQDFKLKHRNHQAYVEIPVKLKKAVVDGELTIPVTVQCGACTEDEAQCSVFESKVDVPVVVRSSADDGEEEQALKRGTVTADVQLVF
jgi:hypothetical protein